MTLDLINIVEWGQELNRSPYPHVEENNCSSITTECKSKEPWKTRKLGEKKTKNQ